MADKNVNQIVVQLIDKLTAPARNVERSIKGIQQAAKGGQLDLVGFNRALFATTAFVGTVQRAFTGMFSAIAKGAELGRLSDQFERVLGPQGHFFNLISQFTDTSVDRVEALRSGIELANLGISRNAEVTAAMIAKASVAAKRGGFDAATGIKEYTAFLKDGSIAHLENIGLINRANMSYMIQQKILESSGGTMGGVIALQARYSIGQMLLNQRTSGLMHGHRDLVDVLQRLGNTFVDLRRNIGQFLGEALTPIIDKVSDMASRFSSFLGDLKKNHKGVLELAKSFIVATGALATFLVSLVVLKNVLLGIKSLGFGLTGFFGIFLGLMVTDKVIGLANAFSLLARFTQDVTYQLVLWGSQIAKALSPLTKTINALYEWVAGTKLFIESGNTIYKMMVKLTAATIAFVFALKGIAIARTLWGMGSLASWYATEALTGAAVLGTGKLGAAKDLLGLFLPGMAGTAGAASKTATMIGKFGMPIAAGAFGAMQTVSTAMNKKSTTEDVLASVVGDTLLPIIGAGIGSIFGGPVGGMLGIAAGQGIGALTKTYIFQTDRTVDAINEVNDTLSDEDNILPKMPDTQLELIGKIAEMMGGIRGEQREVFAEAFRTSVMPLGEGGKDITVQEYIKLQKITNGFLKDIRDQKAAAYSGPRKFKGVDIMAWH